MCRCTGVLLVHRGALLLGRCARGGDKLLQGELCLYAIDMYE